jgi:hypothetical protein
VNARASREARGRATSWSSSCCCARGVTRDGTGGFHIVAASAEDELAAAIVDAVRSFAGKPVPAAQVRARLPQHFVTTDEQVLAIARRTAGLEVFGPKLIRIAIGAQENTHGTPEEGLNRQRAHGCRSPPTRAASSSRSCTALGRGFDQKVDLKASEPGMSAASMCGVATKAPRRRASWRSCLPAGAWGRANADEVQVLSYSLPEPETEADQYPQFAVVKDAEDKLEVFFDLAYPPHQIDKLPSSRRSTTTSASRPTRPTAGRCACTTA